jgi:hypothetical protein
MATHIARDVLRAYGTLVWARRGLECLLGSAILTSSRRSANGRPNLETREPRLFKLARARALSDRQAAIARLDDT